MDLTRRRLLASAATSSLLAAPSRTRVGIVDTKWSLNGTVTYAGAQAEGLLMNVRMVNAVFEDSNAATRPKEFDPEANTMQFLRSVPEYVSFGVRAFTISLQGGDPGYDGAGNSAMNPEGVLKKPYMERVAKVIDTCDRHGAAVILSCFYQRQDQIQRDEEAIRTAVVNVARWVARSRFRNVVLEITNEFGHRGFNHPILKTATGQAALITLAKRTAPGLLVSTSGLGDGRMPPEVAGVADFLTPHLNTTNINDVAARIADLRRYGKAILVNEDDKTGELGARAASLCVENRASWGFMASKVNQRFPFQYGGANDDPAVYAILKHVTTAGDYFPPSDAEGGWRTRSDSRQIRRDKLDEAFQFIQGSTRNGGLLVLHKGWLVYEKYFGLGHRDVTPNLASCGKIFTSIAAGILLGQRPEIFPEGLDQQVFTPQHLPPAAFPLSDPRKKEIKLGQLLAMTAGIRGNNPVHVRGKQSTIDPAGPDGAVACVDKVAFGGQEGTSNGRSYSAKTLWCEPGGGYSYATSSVHIVSAMIRHLTGGELDRFVDRCLAQPLGWGDWGYAYRQVKELEHTPGGGGIALRATDMLRFGFLLANEGRWKDRQLIPRDYVLHCGRQSPYNPHFPYSLQFDVNTDGHETGIPKDAFWKSGSGGHVLYVVPSLELVVWKLGGRDGQYATSDTGRKPSPAPPERVAERSTWKETIDADTARRRTLSMVVASIKG